MHKKSGLDEGFTQMPNKVIMEIFIKGLLSRTEIRIAFYIIRWSWGFHRVWTNKCTVQKMAKDIGISRQLCSTTINQMVRENKLLRSEGRFKFNDEYQDWIKVLTNPDGKYPQKLTESVNKSRRLVSTNPDTAQLDDKDQISTLKNPEYSIKERINKEERNIKERKITFNKQIFKFENISEEKLEKWKEAFPSVNVSVELKRMEVWLTANPKRLKRNYEKFIVNWLSRTKGEKNERYIPLSRRAVEKGSEGKSYAPGE